MKLGESLRISWRTITSHKLRSTLTTLGVIVGIGSVITFMILGGAFSANILGDVGAMNEPVMKISTQRSTGAVGIQQSHSPIYTESDVEALRQLDNVEYVAPLGSVPAAQLSHGNDSITGMFAVQATTTDRFEHGEPHEFTEGEVFSGDDQAVMNTRAAQLFEKNVSAGETVTLSFQDGSKKTVTVTGIVDEDIGSHAASPIVYVPLGSQYATTVRTPGGEEKRAYSGVEIRATSMDDVDSVKQAAANYMHERSDARKLKADDFDIVVETIRDEVDRVSSTLDQLTVLIGGIAAISLVVGSIGIANMMIVSVTERTREIGIMKSIGARKRDIVQLFLVESIILGAIGAVFGILVGIGFGYLAVTLAEWPMTYPVDWITIAAAVGVGVGIVSGLYPAVRAARIDPIEALRQT
ncbi:hypothetical protein ZOD2009_20367 [Haladaptatus paucihalophilus DX253]|uniref:Putative ABC transport system permease protein n=1 Tax=Haladaptatus paucihalophilus DX253 TaxID=797209 RepID=E7QZ66_HALPU|nr:ABC transporter permease [Haladaptatus paucihalophilus]EFW89987.1 hypothetical protein ZOD2009_20367 [Haladaptatus paucihalophilus DX253]SHL01788.1 putative ABC transport system permease protein [Haladaptatus paucihalophilus DX253]